MNDTLADHVGAWIQGHDDVVADPWPLFAQLREHSMFFEWNNMVIATRFDDVEALLADPRLSNRKRYNAYYQKQLEQLSASDAALARQWIDFQAGFLGSNDPPDHSRRRKLQMHGFYPRHIVAVQEYVERTVDRLLDQAEERGTFDFVSDFAYPLPMMVIAHMLGVPEQDMDVIIKGSQDLAYVFGLGFHHVPEVAEGLTAFRAYAEDMVERRRKDPQDDLLGAMITAQEVGDSLTPLELVTSFFNLLFSGHETTTTSLANGMLAMLQNPDQWRMLCDDLDLTGQAVEELLRFTSPVQYIQRAVPQEIDYQGERLREGMLVRLVIAAANHDPAQFTDPGRLDIHRPQAEAANVVFGRGAHFCMGVALARLEMRTALGAIARRFPGLAFAGDADQPLRWNANPLMRRVVHLPIAVRGGD